MSTKPVIRLGQATPSEVNAAFKVAHDKVSALIDHLINQYMQSGFAAMFRNQAQSEAHAWLESPAGKAQLVDFVDGVLDAAQHVRDQETK